MCLQRWYSHAICGSLTEKIRHVYDVAMLFPRKDIQEFLNDKAGLKHLLEITKQTDSFYLEKRNTSVDYTPLGAYDFPVWREAFNGAARERYEKLHEILLYTDQKQNFGVAVSTFDKLNQILGSDRLPAHTYLFPQSSRWSFTIPTACRNE